MPKKIVKKLSDAAGSKRQQPIEPPPGSRIHREPKWKLNEKILCKWPGFDGYYPAKIVVLVEYEDQPLYTVRYIGYKKANDLQIAQEFAYDSFLPYVENYRNKEMATVKTSKLAESKEIAVKVPKLAESKEVAMKTSKLAESKEIAVKVPKLAESKKAVMKTSKLAESKEIAMKVPKLAESKKVDQNVAKPKNVEKVRITQSDVKSDSKATRNITLSIGDSPVSNLRKTAKRMAEKENTGSVLPAMDVSSSRTSENTPVSKSLKSRKIEGEENNSAEDFVLVSRENLNHLISLGEKCAKAAEAYAYFMENFWVFND